MLGPRQARRELGVLVTATLEDPGAILYFDRKGLHCPDADLSHCTLREGLDPEPLVLRAAAGDCIQVTLHNAMAFEAFQRACSTDGSTCDRYGALCPDDGDDDSGICQYYSSQKHCLDGTSCDSDTECTSGDCGIGTCGGAPIFVEGGQSTVLNSVCTPGKRDSTTDYSCVYSSDAYDAGGDPVGSGTPTFQACAGEEVRFRLLHPGGAFTNQVFELYGHSFSSAPYMTRPESCPPSPELGDYAGLMQTNVRASQYIGTKNLCGSREWLTDDPPRQGPLWDLPLAEYQGSRMGQGPSNHSDLVIESAGGPAEVAGDYLYRTYPAVHVGRGLWGIFRVVDPESGELICLKPSAEAASGP